MPADGPRARVALEWAPLSIMSAVRFAPAMSAAPPPPRPPAGSAAAAVGARMAELQRLLEFALAVDEQWRRAPSPDPEGSRGSDMADAWIGDMAAGAADGEDSVLATAPPRGERAPAPAAAPAAPGAECGRPQTPDRSARAHRAPARPSLPSQPAVMAGAAEAAPSRARWAVQWTPVAAGGGGGDGGMHVRVGGGGGGAAAGRVRSAGPDAAPPKPWQVRRPFVHNARTAALSEALRVARGGGEGGVHGRVEEGAPEAPARPRRVDDGVDSTRAVRVRPLKA